MAKLAAISKQELKQSIAYIAIIVGIIAVSSLLLTTQFWFFWPIIVGATFVMIALFFGSKSFYQCPCCNKPFKITALQDFFAPHGLTRGGNGEIYEWKLLKCRGCGKREKCYRVESKPYKPM